MRTPLTLALAAGLVLPSAAAWADTVVVRSSASVSVSPSGSSSEASFNGHDGKHIVNGDVIEIRRGLLTVNGVSHGRVAPGSWVRYFVQGDTKILTVDGEARPLRK